jgi:DNA invertase Pin-like site-specific DNA recombinase
MCSAQGVSHIRHHGWSYVLRAIGYTRVSTKDQSENGHSLDAQRTAIELAVAQRGWELLAVETDVATGKHTNGRGGLHRAIERIEAGEAEALVITKLDRLARSAADFANTLRRANERGWSLVILDLSLDTATPMGKFTAQVIAAVAELEREMIVRRTKEGIEAARAKGVKMGPPLRTPPAAIRRAAELRAEGYSLERTAETMNAEGLRTSTGRLWTYGTVRQCLRYVNRIDEAEAALRAQVEGSTTSRTEASPTTPASTGSPR